MRQVTILANGADMETRKAFFEKAEKMGFVGDGEYGLERFLYYPEESELERLLALIPEGFTVTVVPPL